MSIHRGSPPRRLHCALPAASSRVTPPSPVAPRICCCWARERDARPSPGEPGAGGHGPGLGQRLVHRGGGRRSHGRAHQVHLAQLGGGGRGLALEAGALVPAQQHACGRARQARGTGRHAGFGSHGSASAGAAAAAPAAPAATKRGSGGSRQRVQGLSRMNCLTRGDLRQRRGRVGRAGGRRVKQQHAGRGHARALGQHSHRRAHRLRTVSREAQSDAPHLSARTAAWRCGAAILPPEHAPSAVERGTGAPSCPARTLRTTQGCHAPGRGWLPTRP